MHQNSGTSAARRGWRLAAFRAGRGFTLLYYLAVLLGLVVLYGRGDVSTVGFIYQAF
jgi:hypothetical protein